MIPILIAGGLFVAYIWNSKKQKNIGGYQTRFFDSSIHSSLTAALMKESDFSNETIADFCAMEDHLLMLCKEGTRPYAMSEQSIMIKNKFPTCNFDYHTELLSNSRPYSFKFFDFIS